MGTNDVSETPRHSVSVAAAIFDESGENVLLIKRRDNGHWEPPGGILELDETIDAGLRREVREETGAEIEIGQLTGVYKNMSRGIVALVFRCAALTDIEASSAEADTVSWVPWSEALDRMDEAYAIRLEDAHRTDTVRVRSHDGVDLLDPASPRRGPCLDSATSEVTAQQCGRFNQDQA